MRGTRRGRARLSRVCVLRRGARRQGLGLRRLRSPKPTESLCLRRLGERSTPPSDERDEHQEHREPTIRRWRGSTRSAAATTAARGSLVRRLSDGSVGVALRSHLGVIAWAARVRRVTLDDVWPWLHRLSAGVVGLVQTGPRVVARVIGAGVVIVTVQRLT